jgi:hypothetical protein
VRLPEAHVTRFLLNSSALHSQGGDGHLPGNEAEKMGERDSHIPKHMILSSNKRISTEITFPLAILPVDSKTHLMAFPFYSSLFSKLKQRTLVDKKD